MLLTDSEVKMVDDVCDYVMYKGHPAQIPCIQRYNEAYRPKYTEIMLGKTKLSLRLYEQPYSFASYNWELYIGNTAIHRNDDGEWWDIVRTEIIVLAKKVDDYYEECAENHRVTMNHLAKQRS